MNGPKPAQGKCAHCIHFDSDARMLEALIPGLASLGSGDGSTRSDDGYCAHHKRLMGARAWCGEFTVRSA